MISQKEKQIVIDRLNERLKDHGVHCPMCGNQHFIVADGYFNTPMQDQSRGVVLGGPVIPSIPIICNRCGFVSMHALGVLGLLSDTNEKKEDGHAK